MTEPKGSQLRTTQMHEPLGFTHLNRSRMQFAATDYALNMPEHKSRLRASISRWASQEREEAKELRKDTRKAGLVTIDDAPDRQKVVVQGTLKTVTLRPRGGVPALEAELYDGSGSISVVWLGRRRIGGISPGRAIRVEGRIGVQDGIRVMYNPRYDLRPMTPGRPRDERGDAGPDERGDAGGARDPDRSTRSRRSSASSSPRLSVAAAACSRPRSRRSRSR